MHQKIRCILFAWIIIVSTHIKCGNISLYRPEDSVLILHKNDIHTKLSNQTTPSIVVFYVSWCSHCRRFAPIFSSLAKEYRFQNITFAAINCADEETQETCSLFGVDRFPSLKTVRSFVPVSPTESSNVVSYNGPKSINGLRKLVRELILNSVNDSALYEINELTEDTLKKFYEKNGQAVMFIVFGDDNDDTISLKLVMDTSLCKRFYVYKVSDPNSAFYKKFNIGKSPLIIAVRYPGNFTLISPNDPTNTSMIRRDIYRHFSFICPDASALYSIAMMNDEIGTKLTNYTTDDHNLDSVDEISFDDLNGAISYFLRHEIGAKTLVNRTMRAAIEWLQLVSKCIPWSKEEREQLDGITVLLNNTHNPLNVSEFSAIVHSTKMNEIFPLEQKWANCKGSTELYRGFPCSMWILFHTMLTTCENQTPHIPYNSTIVLLSIRQYIDEFFTCAYCRNHFLYMTANVTNEITTNEEAILYLWNKHNTVNSRLRYDESADPEHPKIQFPHITSCSKCYNTTNLNSKDIFVSNPGFGTPSIGWNKKEILTFLRHYYSPENIRLSRSSASYPSDPELFNVDDVSKPSLLSAIVDINFLYLLSISFIQFVVIILCVILFMCYIKSPIKFFRSLHYSNLIPNKTYKHMI